MPTIQNVCDFFQSFAPNELAEDWDNVGLLVGDRAAPVERIMTCLTITPGSAAEAIENQANLIVAHHPLPFRSLARVTSDDTAGQILLQLIRAGVSVFSPHTAFDSAAQGINQCWATGLSLSQIAPLEPQTDDPQVGGGRFGLLSEPVSLAELAERVKQFLSVELLRVVGDRKQNVYRVAVACGSAGSFLARARQLGCDVFVTGETTFHTCLEAEALGVGLILTGHFASERFAVAKLADILDQEFHGVHVWASNQEADPLWWM